MAEDNRALHATIGFTVVLGVVAVAGALVYLGGLRGGRDLGYGETYFRKSVSGLSVGSPVNFRGVKVGEVSSIGFVGDEYDVSGADRHLICVRMAFPRSSLGFSARDSLSPEEVRREIEKMSLRATVTASGITGLSRIEIDIQTNVPPLTVAWTPRTVYIPPAVSLLESFSDAATKVMNQINRMDVAGLWSNVNAAVEAISKTAEGTEALLESRRGDIEKTAGDLMETMSSLRAFADEIRANPSLLLRERIVSPLPETRR